MKVILGHKVGMTQIWDDKGRLLAATVVEAQPNRVLNSTDTQSTIGTVTKGKTAQPQAKIAEQLNSKTGIWLKTISGKTDEATELTVAQFKVGDEVSIAGVTKGKGFSGVVKRHGFAGWPASHGHSHQRRPGSIGAQQPQRVVKGRKMAGRMGGENLTVYGNKVLAVHPTEHLIVISGTIPGPKRSRVMIQGVEHG